MNQETEYFKELSMDAVAISTMESRGHTPMKAFQVAC